jgi:hypothetical protein
LTGLLVLSWFAADSRVRAFPEYQESSVETRTVPEVGSPVARQNVILRQYFRQRYFSFYDSDSPLSANERFVESFVDSQIDDFIAKTDRRLRELNESYEVASKLRSRLASDPETMDPVALRAYVTVLRRVGKLADNLRDDLAFIFLGLDRKGSLPQSIRSDAQKDFCEDELLYIGEQIDVAEKRIRNYLFEPDLIVDLESLRGENMLIRLYWVEQMTKEIRKRFD